MDDWTELAALRGHERTICAVSWSPDGKRLASGARDNSIRIWNVESRQEEHCIADNGDVVHCVVWLPDGLQLAAAVGPTVRLWNVSDWETNTVVATHQQSVLSLAASPNGQYLASGGYESHIVVYDLISETEIILPTLITATWSLAFSPDGHFLLAGTGRGGPSIWQLHAAQRRIEPVRFGIESSGTQREAFLDPTSKIIGDGFGRRWPATPSKRASGFRVLLQVLSRKLPRGSA